MTSWCATSPGRRTEWIGTPAPIPAAVALAVPDGASSFVSACSSMISACGNERAASAAKRIISTAPSAKLGATKHGIRCSRASATVKYGKKLRAAFEQPGGAALRQWIDDMPNEQYQALFGLAGADVRAMFLDGAPQDVHEFCRGWDDETLAATVVDLGGHDIASLLEVFRECDDVKDRPSVVFAYTVKGWGLPTAGNPRNHSALLTGDQIEALRSVVGLDPATEWDRIDPATPAGQWAVARREQLALPPAPGPLGVAVPKATGIRGGKPVSTQEVFGRVLVDLSRDEAVAPYLVTTAPDVATSTNLAGFINRTGRLRAGRAAVAGAPTPC